MNGQKTLLVTGGAGFIGSHFIKHVLERYPGCLVVNYDKLTYAGNVATLHSVSGLQNYHFIRGDICDRQYLHTVMKEYRFDYIVNFAAESHVDRSVQNPALFVETNVTGTHFLLDAALKYGTAKFVQISTDEVYGSLGETGYFTETSPLSPNNPYAACKAGADLLARSYHRTYGLPVNFVRFANTYGPSQNPEKLIPMTITNALSNKSIPIHGKGHSIRDWLYVRDNIEAIDLVMHHGRPGEVYNISARQERRTIDIVNDILKQLDKPQTLIEYVDDRPGQDYRYANDPSKIMRELGWNPCYTFERGLANTLEWYMQSLSLK